MSSDLHLIIIAAQTLNHAVIPKPAQVSCLVQASIFILGKWIWNKVFSRKFRTIQISSRKPSSTNQKLPGYTNRNFAELTIHDVDLSICYWPADRDARFCRGHMRYC